MTTPTETTQTPKFKADDLQIEELAAHLLEVSLEELSGEDGEYESRLWNLFYHQFGIEVSDFAKLVNALVPLIEVGKSPLTEKIYKGFANTEKRFWLVKMEVER